MFYASSRRDIASPMISLHKKRACQQTNSEMLERANNCEAYALYN